MRISIHAPREGGDEPEKPKRRKKRISIHAPREGGDIVRKDGIICYFPNFNPRPPRGGRQYFREYAEKADEISIHAPREGGDERTIWVFDELYISIHAPREGGDSKDAQFYLRIFDK